MAQTMRIAEVAAQTGFSPATLRYYEQLDLVPAPQRTAAGYRAYDESVLGRLALIARAKALGCTLDEIATLLPAWDGGRCGPVQERLRELVGVKLGDAEARVADIASFTADLRQALAGLGLQAAEGPCDSYCPCFADPPAAPGSEPATEHCPLPVTCTLDAADMPERVQEWRDLVTHVVDRAPIEGGTRLTLDAGAPLDQLVRLVGAEQSCCRFFAFAITVDTRGVALEVRAPAEGQAMVNALFA